MISALCFTFNTIVHSDTILAFPRLEKCSNSGRQARGLYWSNPPDRHPYIPVAESQHIRVFLFHGSLWRLGIFYCSVFPFSAFENHQDFRATFPPQISVWDQTSVSLPAAGLFFPLAKCRVCSSPNVCGIIFLAIRHCTVFRFILYQDTARATRKTGSKFLQRYRPGLHTVRCSVPPRPSGFVATPTTFSASKHEFSDAPRGESFVEEKKTRPLS